MIMVKGLIWDDWNRKHINQHGITQQEIEEVCHGKHKVKESYRKRILVIGKTKRGQLLAIVLSPEDRDLQPYGNGTYYVITAFKKEVKS
ncbi:hypothetical protein MUP32_04815 [Candidatus Microgenomates bacterium]|nr:hypothetical protein [Candidatus Microgenomates bacterium]